MTDAAQSHAVLREVALGMDVQAFLQGPIGRYLIGRAEETRASALEALVHCDPENAASVRAYQNQVAVVDMVQQWLADAITEGRKHEQELSEQD